MFTVNLGLPGQPERLPRVLLGHSMGGLTALDYALAHPRDLDRVVASSPGLRSAIPPWWKLALANVARVTAPAAGFPTGLDMSGISHDPEVCRLREADSLKHDLISPRLYFGLAEARQRVQREARREEKSRADAGRLRDEIRALETAHEALQGEPEAAPAPPATIEPGQRVRVRDLGVEADVVSGPDSEGRVRLRRGSWSIESHVDRLSAAAPADGGAPARRPIASWSTPEDAAPLEVDLRGMESEEALVALDAGLDRAALVGLSELRIVHGVGRGVLRAAVERHLRGHPQVASQRPGQVGEGGRGVTVAILK